MKTMDTKKLTVLSMLCALAFLLVVVVKIPVVLFLKYEPKDVVITMGGFIYGPLAALIISAVVSLIEMLTISTTGWIGCIMNILSTAAFACTAALIYKKKRTLSGAITGLAVGTILMTIVMLLWNYILTPLYMNTPRADIATMLVPVFLPFNLIKGILNTAITALLYRPVVEGLRKANLLTRSQTSGEKKNILPLYIGAIVLLLIGIALIVYMNFK